MPQVSDALERLASCKALLIGDLVLDAYLYGQTMRVSREAPVPVVQKERTEYRLGGAANTAANLAALGMHVELLGVVGPGDAGERLLSGLSALDIGLDGVLPADVTTPVKTRVLAGALGTVRQQVLRIDDEPEGPLPTALSDELANLLRHRARDADVVVVSDYGLGVVSDAVIVAANLLASEGTLVCVDSRRQLTRFNGCSAATPNVPEAEAVLGFPIRDEKSAARAAHALREKLHCHNLLLTRGRAGMTLLHSGGLDTVEIVGQQEVTDVTGAGDTVIATFAAALAAQIGAQNGMRLANCAAAVVVNKLGTATASASEIEGVARAGAVVLDAWRA